MLFFAQNIVHYDDVLFFPLSFQFSENLWNLNFGLNVGSAKYIFIFWAFYRARNTKYYAQIY